MRILIATMTAGGGHLAAASALEEAWQALRPRDTVERLDLLKFFSPLHRKIHSDGYVKFVESAPELWGMVFKKTDDPKIARRLNKLQQLFPSRSRLRFARHVKHFKPDVVLCTHYAPLALLNELRAKGARLSSAAARGQVGSAAAQRAALPFVVSVVTDFEAHALWMEAGVDLYCVAAEETKARLVARGAPRDTVVATGIPIAAKFSTKPDARAVRRQLGLRDDLPLMLVLS